jgi:catechol 2,3-dioxygenase-like lactoylglutathione lyase family enzyme
MVAERSIKGDELRWMRRRAFKPEARSPVAGARADRPGKRRGLRPGTSTDATDARKRDCVVTAKTHESTEAKMSSVDVSGERSNEALGAEVADMKLEVVVVPVSDIDRASRFYGSLGWRLDANVATDGFRLVQLTPPGSGCSIQFGTNLTPAAPGSVQGLYLVVSDVEAARKELVALGVKVSEVFHEGARGARFHDADGRVSGPAPDRKSYGSFATFSDPDGNGWLLQEITTRLPGRVDEDATSFASVSDLASAMRRASAAHGKHEERIGHEDANWPDWYAEYMVREQAGEELPT